MRIDPLHLPQSAPLQRHNEHLGSGRPFSHLLTSELDRGETDPLVDDAPGTSERVYGFAELGMFGRASPVPAAQSNGPELVSDNTALQAATVAAPPCKVQPTQSQATALPDPQSRFEQSAEAAAVPNVTGDGPTNARIGSPPPLTGNSMYADIRAEAGRTSPPRTLHPAAIITPEARPAVVGEAVRGSTERESVLQPFAQAPRNRAPLRAATAAAALNLTLYEKDGTVTFSAFGPDLAASRARLRRLCGELLQQFGLRLRSGTVNGSPIDDFVPDIGEV